MPSILARLLVLLALPLVAACQTPSERVDFPPITFADRGRIALDVSAIEVEVRYQPPLRAPNVEHLMPVSPEAAARRWAQERLQPASPQGRVVFTIIEAGVTETRLPRRTGLQGVVTTDQSERYDGRIRVELAVIAGTAGAARIEAEATASRTVPENITVNGRRQVWYELTQALMAELDRALDGEIRRNLTRFMR